MPRARRPASVAEGCMAGARWRGRFWAGACSAAGSPRAASPPGNRLAAALRRLWLSRLSAMIRKVGRRVTTLIASGMLLGLLAPGAQAANPAPYGVHDAGGFHNVLPAGEAGNENFLQLAQFQGPQHKIPPHFNDQLPLYQNL